MNEKSFIQNTMRLTSKWEVLFRTCDNELKCSLQWISEKSTLLRVTVHGGLSVRRWCRGLKVRWSALDNEERISVVQRIGIATWRLVEYAQGEIAAVWFFDWAVPMLIPSRPLHGRSVAAVGACDARWRSATVRPRPEAYLPAAVRCCRAAATTDRTWASMTGYRRQRPGRDGGLRQ